jgi:hypothetical protein
MAMGVAFQGLSTGSMAMHCVVMVALSKSCRGGKTAQRSHVYIAGKRVEGTVELNEEMGQR